jgi:archaemetzincin
MKKIIIPLLFFVNNLFAQSPKTIYIQPLGNVNLLYLETAKKSVESFYGYKCIVKEKKPLTVDLLAGSKTRYEASFILNKFTSKENVLVLTEKDIACVKGTSPEWGVLGLGRRPGTVCVVSTYRMKKNVSNFKVLERLEKVVLHEIGHNLGLDHCLNDIHCMMNDAKGTISQIDKEKVYLCKKCKNQIGMK